MQDTLSKRISNNIPLSENEKQSLLDLLGKGCQAKTKRMLEFSIGHIECKSNYGIYSRVHLENEEARYCAGQSYPDEIRTVRQLVIGG